MFLFHCCHVLNHKRLLFFIKKYLRLSQLIRKLRHCSKYYETFHFLVTCLRLILLTLLVHLLNLKNKKTVTEEVYC